jgi:hypothetical protein
MTSRPDQPDAIVYVEERTEAGGPENTDDLTSRDLEATPVG